MLANTKRWLKAEQRREIHARAQTRISLPGARSRPQPKLQQLSHSLTLSLGLVESDTRVWQGQTALGRPGNFRAVSATKEAPLGDWRGINA